MKVLNNTEDYRAKLAGIYGPRNRLYSAESKNKICTYTFHNTWECIRSNVSRDLLVNVMKNRPEYVLSASMD